MPRRKDSDPQLRSVEFEWLKRSVEFQWFNVGEKSAMDTPSNVQLDPGEFHARPVPNYVSIMHRTLRPQVRPQAQPVNLPAWLKGETYALQYHPERDVSLRSAEFERVASIPGLEELFRARTEELLKASSPSNAQPTETDLVEAPPAADRT